MKFEKNMRIITDLLGYCYYIGGSDFHLDFQMEPEVTHIHITATVPNLSAKDVQELSRVLNTPRQRDMEQNYWNVSGGEDVDGELLLAGIMIDSAAVSYEGEVLSILAERLHYSTLE